jgi:hypothetical protein
VQESAIREKTNAVASLIFILFQTNALDVHNTETPWRLKRATVLQSNLTRKTERPQHRQLERPAFCPSSKPAGAHLIGSRLYLVRVSLTADVTDNSDPAPVCLITDVTSNEAAAETAWHITGLLTLDLRAQRFGISSQLSSSANVTVRVPHDQRQ